MKSIIALSFITAISVICSFAAPESWTNKEGKSAMLDLQSTSGEGDDLAGRFKMQNGKLVTIKAVDLSDADAKRLVEWKPAPPPPIAAEGKPSVFDKILDGNLVKLDGKRLKKYEPTTKPKKYYVFYYTASWCPPCQAFTPDLVKFYEKHKNDSFELILITSDRDQDAMEEYAVNKKMPWPQLKHSEVGDFKKEFQHGVKGIPSVIICDLKGEIVSSEGRSLTTLESFVK